MKNFYKIFIISFLIFSTAISTAQSLFKATILGGLNMSQVDGDKQQGFRKPGMSIGLSGSIFVQPDFEISTELLYNEKGSKPNPNKGIEKTNLFSTFSLQYSEIALLAHYHYSPNSSKSYYVQSLYAGLSYGRLLKSSTSIVQNNLPYTKLESEVTSKFNRHDFSFIVGWSYLFTERIGISMRYTSTMNFLYTNPDYRFASNEAGFEHLKPYFVSFHLFYNLLSPNKVMGLKSKKQKARTNPLEELY